MRGVVLQDWTAARVNDGVIVYTQDDRDWLDLEAFTEATFWVEVSSVDLPTGATSPYVTLQLQTSPSHDETLFVPAAGPLLLTSMPPGTTLVRTTKAVSAIGLARWVRWQLSVQSAGTNWGARFRIVAIPATRSYFTPLSLPGCVLWLRADLGLTLSATGTVTGWADQGPTRDANRNLVLGAGGAPTITPSNSLYAGQATVNFASASNQYLVSSGAWSSALAQPDTWIVVGHNTSAGITAQYLIDSDDGGTGQQVQYVPSPTTTITLSTAGHTLPFVSSWASPAMLLGEWNGVSSTLYLGTVESPSATGGLGTATQGSLTLGAKNASAGGGSNWDGQLAEIIGITGTLSMADKLRLKRYLNGRYSIGVN